MKNSNMQLTIREMKQQLASSRFWAGLLGVVCILTVAAPFSTGTQFDTIQRFFYWGGIAISTYLLAIFVLLICRRFLQDRYGLSEMAARMVASFAAAVAVALLVFFINSVVLGIDEFRLKSFIILGLNCIAVALAVCAIFFIVNDSLQQANAADSDESPASDNPAFYKRLPENLGTDLISLQAQDHYVEAKTTLGRELVLVRLSDAIGELGADSGLQVHRSWWVSRTHIVEQKRIDNKPYLILSDGSQIPVSRTYLAAVKAALANGQS